MVGMRYWRFFRVNDRTNRRHQEWKHILSPIKIQNLSKTLLLLWCLVTAFTAVPSCGTDQSWWEGPDVWLRSLIFTAAGGCIRHLHCRSKYRSRSALHILFLCTGIKTHPSSSSLSSSLWLPPRPCIWKRNLTSCLPAADKLRVGDKESDAVIPATISYGRYTSLGSNWRWLIVWGRRVCGFQMKIIKMTKRVIKNINFICSGRILGGSFFFRSDSFPPRCSGDGVGGFYVPYLIRVHLLFGADGEDKWATKAASNASLRALIMRGDSWGGIN